MKYLTFLIESKDNDALLYRQLTESDEAAPVISLKNNEREKLRNLLNTLNSDTKIYVLFHLGQRSKKAKYFKGENILSNYAKTLPGLKLTKNRHYFSRSRQTLAGGTVIPFSEVELLGESSQFPSPVTPRALLSNSANPKIYSYSLQNKKINQWLFEQTMDDDAMELILGESLDAKAEDVKIKVLIPGFSGAHVLEVKFTVEGISQTLILKMDREKESLEKELNFANKIRFSSLPRLKFIRTDCKALLRIREWYVLTYHAANNRTPLVGLLGLKKEKLKKVYRSLADVLINDFTKVVGGLHVVENRCWLSSSPVYEGLAIWVGTQKRIVREIEFMIGKFKSKIQISNKEKDLLIQFIKNGTYGGLDIDQQTFVPVTRAHGDMHTSNVLTNQNGTLFEIIDFAMTPEKSTKHAFLDLAKLAVDTEMNMMPDHLFILNKGAESHLEDWIIINEQWIKNCCSWVFNKKKEKWENNLFATGKKSITKGIHNRYLNKAYELNDVIILAIGTYVEILQNEIPIEGKLNLKDNSLLKELYTQFQLTRLHYLLKYISYSNIIFEKRLFALKASVDILKFIQP